MDGGIDQFGAGFGFVEQHSKVAQPGMAELLFKVFSDLKWITAGFGDEACDYF